MKRLLYVLLAMMLMAFSQQVNECYGNARLQGNTHKKAVLKQKATLSEFRKLDRDKQIAIWGEFTPAQRYGLWQSRFKEAKKLNWTADEKLHIEKAESYLKSHKSFFSGRQLTDQQDKELNDFFSNWSDEAKKKFGWTPYLSGKMIMSFEKVTEKDLQECRKK